MTPAGEVADSVFTNGRIYTVDETRPWAEAVAIKDGKLRLDDLAKQHHDQYNHNDCKFNKKQSLFAFSHNVSARSISDVVRVGSIE